MKTEKEKMLAGEYYNAADEELVRERDHTRKLGFELNHTSPGEKRKGRSI